MAGLSGCAARFLAAKFRRGSPFLTRQFRSKATRDAIARAANRLCGQNAQMTCVVYHYPCFDGAFAALAAHLYHSVLGLPAVFLPNSIIDPLRVEDFDCKRIHTCYLLDFVGPEGFAISLSKIVKEVVVLDHHKTACDRLALAEGFCANITSVIDINKSSATIAYEHFSQKLAHERCLKKWRKTLVSEQSLDRVELLFRYVEDADLWRWSLPESKAFTAGLSMERSKLNSVANPYIFDQLLDLDPKVLITNGRMRLQSERKVVEQLLEKAFQFQLGGGIFGKCLGVRADAHSDRRSELGNKLSIRSASDGLRAIGAVIYEQRGKLKISLRTADNSIDTSEIARVYGGGGHAGASSFYLCHEEYRKWKC